MINLTINKTINISADFSADQWCLYTATLSKEVVDFYAHELNYWLEQFVNSGMSREDVESHMHIIMNTYKDCGAYDTEPRAFLTSVLNKIYGE